jgi:hypothetical protein
MQLQIEYITREQDENRSNTSKIGQATHSIKVTALIAATSALPLNVDITPRFVKTVLFYVSLTT